jgi:hypothetical protein
VFYSKNGSHFLDKEEDFYTIRKALKDAVYPCFKYDLITTASGWKEEGTEGGREGGGPGRRDVHTDKDEEGHG